MNATRDREYMALAFALAARAAGRTSPNPCVGAVVAAPDGRIVGHGWHEACGRPHAEALALAEAGAAATGATLYLTLEPCVHWGHTPPCVDAVLTSGIVRAVIADRDANPAVSGRGLLRLRRAGIDVSTGLLADWNRALNAAYIKRIRTGLPLVTLKAALSLDGRMATRTGDSRWITGPAARAYAHLLRFESDAVIVGAGTARRDDPRLSVRLPGRKGKAVRRVVLDGDFRLPPNARLLASPGGPVLVIGREGAGAKRRGALERAGAETMSVGPAARGEGLDLRAVLKALAALGAASVMVEGGGRLATSFLEGGLVDRGLFVYGPRLIGGRDAVSVLGGRGPAGLDAALPLKGARFFRLEADLAVEGAL